MTTNFEDPAVPMTAYGFFTFVYWYLWANGYAAMTKGEWWAFPINLYFLGGVLNFML